MLLKIIMVIIIIDIIILIYGCALDYDLDMAYDETFGKEYMNRRHKDCRLEKI